MIKKFLVGMVATVSLFALVGCKSAEKTEEKKDVKIVSTTVAPVEVLDRLDMDLVGIPTTKSKLPERYKGVTEVGSAMAPNLETIVSLMPDIVIIDKNFKDKYESQLEEKKIKGFYFDTSSIAKFKESIVELGGLIGGEKKAKALVEEIDSEVNKVLEKGKKSDKKPRVAILFGTAQSSMLATDKSYVGDLVEQIGATNITDEISGVDSAYVNFSLEEIVKLNPDYILRLSHGSVEESKKAFDKMFSENPAWSSLDATKNGKVLDLDPSIYGVSANIRVSKAVNLLGNFIYGE